LASLIKTRTKFLSFQRCSETENMNNEGIGIGLCVSRRIVKSLDGEIFFVSEPTVRQGSTFTFTIMATNPI
jgi:signal transduction histidine kinase